MYFFRTQYFGLLMLTLEKSRKLFIPDEGESQSEFCLKVSTAMAGHLRYKK